MTTDNASFSSTNPANNPADLPKNIHFVWLGNIGEIQRNYIQAWKKTNPDYKVNIWYDPDALLAYELGKQIKNFALQNQLVNSIGYANRIIQLQNEAYQAISQSLSAGKTFDQAATEFMVGQLGSSSEDLGRVSAANLASFEFFRKPENGYQLTNVNSLFEQGKGIDKKYYQLELALRQNLAAASDILRINALNQQGGIYFDADFLPAMKPAIFASFENSPLLRAAGPDAGFIKTQLLLEHLKGDFPGRQTLVDGRQYIDYVSKFAGKSPANAELVQQMRDSLRNAGSSASTFFQPLKTEQLPPDGIRLAAFGNTATSVSNAGIVAHAGSASLAAVAQEITANYRRLEDSGLIHIRDVAEIGQNTDNYAARMATDGVTPSTENFFAIQFRKDGIMPSDGATISISGPTAIKQGVQRFLKDQAGPGKAPDPVDLFHQFNGYTEEETKHSWKADNKIKDGDLFTNIITREQLSKDAAVIAKPRGSSWQTIMNSIDKLHSTSGTEQLETAFILQNQLRDYKEKNPGSGRNKAFGQLKNAIDKALFSADMSAAKASISRIAQKQPAQAARLYQAAFNEAEASFRVLADGTKVLGGAEQTNVTTLQRLQGPVDRARMKQELADGKTAGDKVKSAATLSKAQVDGISWYTSTGYQYLNETLRERGELQHFVKTQGTDALTGLDQLEAYKGTVYRALYVEDLPALEGRLRPGKLVSDHGFLSTSSSAEFAKDFRGGKGTVIYAIEGVTDGHNIAGYAQLPQAEVLLAPGSHFRVKATKLTEQNLYVLLEPATEFTSGEAIRNIATGEISGQAVSRDSSTVMQEVKASFGDVAANKILNKKQGATFGVEDVPARIEPATRKLFNSAAKKKENKKLSFNFNQSKDLLTTLSKLMQEIGEVRITKGDKKAAKEFREGLCLALSARYLMEERKHGAGGGKAYINWLQQAASAYKDNQPITGTGSPEEIARQLSNRYHRQQLAPAIVDLLSLQDSQNRNSHAGARGQYDEVFKANGLDKTVKDGKSAAKDALTHDYKTTMDSLKDKVVNTYYAIRSGNHAMALTVTQHKGKRSWAFFDPNLGAKSFDNYDNFRSFMDELHKTTLFKLYDYPAAGKEASGQGFLVGLNQFSGTEITEPDSLWKHARHGEQRYLLRALQQQGTHFKLADGVTGQITDYLSVEGAAGAEQITSVTIRLTDKTGKVIMAEVAARDFKQAHKTVTGHLSALLNHENGTNLRISTKAKAPVVHQALSDIAAADNKPLKQWEKTAVKLGQDGGKTRFDGQLIIQLENDPVVREAAARLVGKHPQNSVLVQLDAKGNYRVVEGDPARLQGKKHLRWQLVGHGRGGEAGLNNQTLAGQNPQTLAANLGQLAEKLSAGKPEYISLVGCSLAADEAQSSYAQQLGQALDKQGIRADIAARRVRMEVGEDGRKRTESTNTVWQHKISDDKQILSWNTQGKLVPASDLSVRLPQVTALMEQLKSGSLEMHQLDARQRQILADFFPAPDGKLNHRQVQLTLLDQSEYQRWTTEAMYLQQLPQIHSQLTGLTGQAALERTQTSTANQTTAGEALQNTYQNLATGKVTGTVLPVAQGLYLSDGGDAARGATALGLAWLAARHKEGDAGAHRLLNGLDSWTKINEQRALGPLSEQDQRQLDAFSKSFGDLKSGALTTDGEIFTRQSALPSAEGDYLLTTGTHQLALSDRMQEGQRHFYLYDPEAGEISFTGPDESASRTARDNAVGEWQRSKNSGAQPPEYWQVNSQRAQQKLAPLAALQTLLTDFNSESARMMQAADVDLKGTRLSPLTVTLIGATVDGKPLATSHLSDPALATKLRFDADSLLRYLASTGDKDTGAAETLRFLSKQAGQADSAAAQLFSGTDDEASNSALEILKKINSQPDKPDSELLSAARAQVPGRFLSGLNRVSGYGSDGMQTYGYLSGVRQLLQTDRELKRTDLTGQQRQQLLFQRDLAAASFGVNIGTDLVQFGLGKLTRYSGKVLNGAIAGPSSRLGRIALKTGGTRLARMGGTALGMLGSGFDFYEAYSAFSQLATTTDPKARQDLIVNGSFAVIGGVTGIALPLAGIALAGTAAAAYLGPIGFALGVSLILGQQIYAAVRTVEEIEKYRPLTHGERLDTGWREFTGQGARPYIMNGVARQQTEQQVREEYDDQLQRQAEQLQDSQQVDTVYYSLGSVELKGHYYRKIVGIETEDIFSNGTPKTIEDKVMPDETSAALRRLNSEKTITLSSGYREESKYSQLQTARSEYKYYTLDRVNAVDDTVDANLDNGWNVSGEVRRSQQRNQRQQVAELVDEKGNKLTEREPADSWHYSLTGDFNGDNHQDIAYFSQPKSMTDKGGLYLLLADGRGGYAMPRHITGAESYSSDNTGERPYSLRMAGDINGDKRDDIVLYDTLEGKMRVLLAQPDGGFAITTHLMTPYQTPEEAKAARAQQIEQHLSLADINGDGRADLIAVGLNKIYVGYGQLNGRFSAKNTLYNPKEKSDHPHFTVHMLKLQLTGDINGDGCADVISIRKSGDIDILLGSASQEKKFTRLLTQQYKQLVDIRKEPLGSRQLLEDIDGDGRADLVIIRNNGSYLIARGQTDGRFGAMTDDYPQDEEKGQQKITYRPNLMPVSSTEEKTIGITRGADGHQALLSYNKIDGKIYASSFKARSISDLVEWFRLGDGNDTATGHLERKNVFEVAAGIKRFTGGQVEDSFLLMGVSYHSDNLLKTMLDGREGEDTIIATDKLAKGGYSIDLETGHLKNSEFPSQFYARLRNIEHAQGHRESNDILTGNAADNRLNGAGGHDVLTGHAGNDTLTLQAGSANGGAGMDTYHLLAKKIEGNRTAQVTLKEVAGESSNLLLDYSAGDLQPLMKLEGNDLVFTLRNKNSGAATWLRLKDAYGVTGSGKDQKKVLQHQWLLYTRDGLMFGLPGEIKPDQQGNWPSEIALNGQQQLAVTYLPAADRAWQADKNHRPAEQIHLRQQSRNAQGLSEVVIYDRKDENKPLHSVTLPEFMRLMPQPTALKDELEGDDNSNLLQNLGGGDILRGKGGADVYQINHDWTYKHEDYNTDNSRVIIDNKDSSAAPAQDVLILPWDISQIGLSTDGSDVSLHRYNTRIFELVLSMRLRNFLVDESYRHLRVHDVNGGQYALTVDALGKPHLGHVQFTDQNDDVVVSHWSSLTTKGVVHAGDGDDSVLDKTGRNADQPAGGMSTTFYGEAGHDSLIALSGNNTFSGGTDNDFLSGGTGNDSYLFASGDGQDIIEDTGGQDNLHFTDIARERLMFSREGDDLMINIRDSEDSVTVTGAFSGPADNLVETIKTSGNATLEVSQLVTAMRELMPSETPVSLPGTGYLTVQDGQGRVSQLRPDHPAWTGTEAAGSQALHYSYTRVPVSANGKFFMQRLDASQSVTPVIITDRQPPVPANSAGKFITGSHTAENVISVAQGNAVIYGGNRDDELSVIKSGHNNQLYGLDGEDILQVTGGHNELYGGKDSDTYRIGGDVSHAIINDESGDKDTLSLEQTGIDITHVRLKRKGDDLQIAVTERPGQRASLVTIKNQFGKDGQTAVEKLIITGAEKIWRYSLTEAMSSFEADTAYALPDVPGSHPLIKSNWSPGLDCDHPNCAAGKIS